MRLVVSFLFGLLAEIATGLVIVAGMLITRGSATPTRPSDLPSWVPVVAIVAGFLFTFLIGHWRASRHADRAMTHALVVAVGAIALHLASTLGVGQTVTVVLVIADLLKLAAGVAAGMVARRRASLSAS